MHAVAGSNVETTAEVLTRPTDWPWCSGTKEDGKSVAVDPLKKWSNNEEVLRVQMRASRTSPHRRHTRDACTALTIALGVLDTGRARGYTVGRQRE